MQASGFGTRWQRLTFPCSSSLNTTENSGNNLAVNDKRTLKAGIKEATDYGLQNLRGDNTGVPWASFLSPTYLRLGAWEPASWTNSHRPRQNKESPIPLAKGPGNEKPNRDLVLTTIREPCGICCLIYMSGSPKAPAGEPDPVPQLGTGSWATPTSGPAAVGPVIPWPSTQWHKANQAQQSLPLTPESGLATPGAHGRASFPYRQWQRHMWVQEHRKNEADQNNIERALKTKLETAIATAATKLRKNLFPKPKQGNCLLE